MAGSPGCRITTEADRTYRIPWADLLAKVFEIDVLACPECGGRMLLIAFIAEPTVAKRIVLTENPIRAKSVERQHVERVALLSCSA